MQRNNSALAKKQIVTTGTLILKPNNLLVNCTAVFSVVHVCRHYNHIFRISDIAMRVETRA